MLSSRKKVVPFSFQLHFLRSSSRWSNFVQRDASESPECLHLTKFTTQWHVATPYSVLSIVLWPVAIHRASRSEGQLLAMWIHQIRGRGHKSLTLSIPTRVPCKKNLNFGKRPKMAHFSCCTPDHWWFRLEISLYCYIACDTDQFPHFENLCRDVYESTLIDSLNHAIVFWYGNQVTH